MRKFLMLTLLLLAFNMTGCPAATVAPTGPTVIEQAQDTATKAVLALGEVLIVAPKALKTARLTGQLDKAGYNNAVDIYNQALASYTLLNQALQAAITAGKDPTSVGSYISALAKFTADRQLLGDIITATGVP